MKNQVTKNYFYNLIYQVIILIIPVITAPYLARILGAQGIGIYSYNYSIAYYFGLFAMLGVNDYGNRSIAKCLEDEYRINKTFCEIFYMQFLMGAIILFVYIGYSLLLSDNILISLCYIPFIISYILDISWFFFGKENFKIILVRNTIIKLLTAISIFTFVKSKNDVCIYILIMSIGNLFSQIIVWVIVLKRYHFLRVEFKDIWKHFKPNLILFIPVIAVSIYRIMDKIMLGIFSSMEQVGYYENAEKIISILLSFITALGTVMLPRMSALFAKNDKKQIKKMISNSMVYVSFVTPIVTFGVAAIANNLVSVYYGNNYLASGKILQLLCITVPFISYANIVRMQILVPQSKDKEYVISCFAGAIINVILNYILIPRLYAVGAAVGTIAAELTVLLVQVLAVKDSLYIKNNIKSIALFWCNGIIMFLGVSVFQRCYINNIIKLIGSVLLGALIYGIMLMIQLLIFRDAFLTMVLTRLKQKKYFKEYK